MTKMRKCAQALNAPIKFNKSKIDAYINIFYHKYTTKICLINLDFSKFLS